MKGEKENGGERRRGLGVGWRGKDGRENPPPRQPRPCEKKIPKTYSQRSSTNNNEKAAGLSTDGRIVKQDDSLIG